MEEPGTAADKRKPWQFQPGAQNPKHTMPDRSGRQPGSKNRLTKVKDAVLNAFDRAGGEDYLYRLAKSKKERHLFIQLLAKAIPTEVTGKDGGPIEIHVLHIAKQGLAKLSDERLQLLYDLLCEIGVNDIITEPANDGDATPLLEAPKEGAAA